MRVVSAVSSVYSRPSSRQLSWGVEMPWPGWTVRHMWWCLIFFHFYSIDHTVTHLEFRDSFGWLIEHDYTISLLHKTIRLIKFETSEKKSKKIKGNYITNKLMSLTVMSNVNKIGRIGKNLSILWLVIRSGWRERGERIGTGRRDLIWMEWEKEKGRDLATSEGGGVNQIPVRISSWFSSSSSRSPIYKDQRSSINPSNQKSNYPVKPSCGKSLLGQWLFKTNSVRNA